MDYEKKYKEALEKARQLCTYPTSKPFISDLQDLFPELKESEDEKAIRDIKVVLESSATKFFKEEGKMPIWYDRAVAWLEKQGEQKPVKFKPLFRVGDVIKPKDPVLGEPRIIKGIHQKFGYDTNNGILDFEFEDNWELVEQKTVWSEEDKRIIDNLISQLGNLFARKLIKEETKDKYVNWLKSLRPQNTWKPSDEQMEVLYRYAEQNSYDGAVLTSLYNDIKKLK